MGASWGDEGGNGWTSHADLYRSRRRSQGVAWLPSSRRVRVGVLAALLSSVAVSLVMLALAGAH
jgi:hypothetical protein